MLNAATVLRCLCNDRPVVNLCQLGAFGCCSGSKVFPSFVQFLKSDDGAAAEKQAALEAELSSLNDHLAQSGPFLKGDSISAGDLALAPKLYHLKIALKELKV